VDTPKVERNTVVTEGALYDWLGGGNSRHTKEIRRRVVGAMAASRRMLQRQRLQAGESRISSKQRSVI
jgi:hypothetical protein